MQRIIRRVTNFAVQTENILLLFVQIPLKLRPTFTFLTLSYCLTILILLATTSPARAENLAIVDAESIRAQLTSNIASYQGDSEQKNLQRFYAQRDYQPVWVLSDHASDLLNTALALIEQADEEGLSSDDYRSAFLQAQHATASYDEVSLPLELDITRALLALARDWYRGRLDAALADPDWHIPQSKFDAVAFLHKAIASGELQQIFTDLLPSIPQYRLLKQSLREFRLLADITSQMHIPESALSIHPYSRHASIPLIRQRILEAHHVFEKPEYDIVADDNDLYDGQLETAIRTFQRQYGLNADGIIGKNTRQALNMTPDEHVRRLRISLERLRWLPKELGKRYILVNIAGFDLAAIENDERIFDMRIVVGRGYRSTPSFSSKISHLVLNPYWNVPRSIARKDLLPKQKNNPDYFVSQGIRVFSDYQYESEIDSYSIDWHSINSSSLPYVFRQEPGRRNALGTIKFMFPNPFSIYLHDTPSKYLFKRDVRTFSSGCIRLERPLQLAEFVLGGAFEQADLAEKIASGKTRTVNLAERVPVYLLYLTTWSDEQDEVHFSSDVYGRDERALAYAHW